MSIKKALSIILVFTLSLGLAACGPKEGEAPTENAPIENNAATTENDEIVLKIGASPAPHTEILTAAIPVLEKEGIKLEIIEFSDYVLPNLALADGSLDANYFQHEPYLIDFNNGNNTDLIAAEFIHYEPMGLYPGKTASIAELKEGAKIAVPNDATNEARALLLLQAQGLIKIREDAGIEATPIDIIENPLNLKIVEIEASQTPAVLKDTDLAVINSNFALEAGVVDTVLTVEDENSVAVEYANVIAVRRGDENKPEILALIKALKSDEVKAFISDKYGEAVKVYES